MESQPPLQLQLLFGRNKLLAIRLDHTNVHFGFFVTPAGVRFISEWRRIPVRRNSRASASPYFGLACVRVRHWLPKLRDTNIVQASVLKAATFSLSFLLLAAGSVHAQAPHDFVSWLRQVGRTDAQHPHAPIGVHHPSPPLPRPRPAELAVVAPVAEPASAAPNTAGSEDAHEQAERTSPAAADNKLTEPPAQTGPVSLDAPDTVQAQPAPPTAPKKAKPAVPIND
jgi:hypothetical protein